MELVQMKQVGFQYPAEDKSVLNNINLQIHNGEFLVLCGASGCGKTTLLRQLKPAIAPHGNLQGEILFQGTTLRELDFKCQTSRIGFVSQNPEEQIVTDKVWHELAFGLESLGMESSVIQKRVAEMSHFFGIQEWFHEETSRLSGGQKQLLNLAAVMVMQPEILLLDEPTSQLDPIAASEFVTALGRIHRELGTTILMTEHRLDEVIPLCTRLLVMEAGEIRMDGTPMEVAEQMRQQQLSLFSAMPAPMRIWNGVETGNSQCPMTVQEGRSWFYDWWESHKLQSDDKQYGKSQHNQKKQEPEKACTVELKDIWFHYDSKGKDVLRGVSFRAYAGELLAVLGGNGSGKSTMLGMIHGGLHSQRGKVRFPAVGMKRVISLPQNPQLLFTEETVFAELEDMYDCRGTGHVTKEDFQKKLGEVIDLCRLTGLLERHPYDVSGGEQQRLALAKILLTQPDILLLDEPTKGFDAEYKEAFAKILEHLTSQGITIIMVSHDVEFCAEYAHRCMLMFDGQIVAEDEPNSFFSENYFYTTNANRMVRKVLPKAVTVSEVIRVCGGQECMGDTKKKDSQKDNDVSGNPEKGMIEEGGKEDRISENLERGHIEEGAKEDRIPENPEKGYIEKGAKEDGTSEKQGKVERQKRKLETEAGKQKLPIGTWAGIIIAVLAIPFTIFVGSYVLKDEKYLFISLLILVEAMLPFVLAFEGRKPPARDVVLLAVFCALGVAGRGVFAMLPSFKPVTAITIIAGVAFGGETGFLVGAVTMLVSNMMFGQGPWTPWQMFAMGMVGLLAGLLFYRKDNSWKDKRKNRRYLTGLCVYGFLSAVLIYGGIMNPSTAILAGIPLNWEVLGAYYISGLPFDLAHGASTVLFLGLGAGMMLRRIHRVKVKYGRA